MPFTSGTEHASVVQQQAGFYLGTSLPVQAGLVSGHGNPTIQGKMPEGDRLDLREFGFAIFIYEADILSDITSASVAPSAPMY